MFSNFLISSIMRAVDCSSNVLFIIFVNFSFLPWKEIVVCMNTYKVIILNALTNSYEFYISRQVDELMIASPSFALPP